MSTPSMPIKIDVAIRPAINDDLSKLEWGGQYWKYRNIFKRTYADQIEGNRIILVADVNEYPIGQIFVQFTKGNPAYADGHTRAYLYALRVMEPFRRNGIGTRLIEEGEGAALERGFSVITIAVAKDNPDALRLYQRLGYQMFGEDPGRWSFTDPSGKVHHVSEPCYAMSKSLTNSGAADIRNSNGIHQAQ